jgi:hypothetical protein
MSMVRTVSALTVDGYGSGEVRFLTRLNNSDPQVQQDFENLFIQPILRVIPSDTITAVLVVEGHADRVDTAGLTREQRRQQ